MVTANGILYSQLANLEEFRKGKKLTSVAEDKHYPKDRDESLIPAQAITTFYPDDETNTPPSCPPPLLKHVCSIPSLPSADVPNLRTA